MGADPKCELCHGTGWIALLNSVSECDCTKETRQEKAVQAVLDCVRRVGMPETETISDAETFFGTGFPDDYDPSPGGFDADGVDE